MEIVEEITLDSEPDFDFGTLPPHVITNILIRLTIHDFKNASLVCKSWFYASCDPAIAEHQLLYFTSKSEVSMDMFSRPITTLRFDYVDFRKFDYMALVRSYGHRITELHLICCENLSITQLFKMFIHLSNLKVLRLLYGTHYKLNNFHKHKQITKHKAKIMQNLGRVEELHIKTTEKSVKGVEILLNYCTNLKTLYWNQNINCDKPDYFMYNILINPNYNCISESLESLIVHTIDREQNSQFFQQLVNLNRTNLRTLELKEISDSYYDVVFEGFCKTYKSLEKLTMYGCNDRQLADICKYMDELKTLDLSNVTIRNYRPIGYLNNLETLTLRRPDDTTNNQVVEIFKRTLKSLTDLTLDYITGDLLEKLCNSLPNLKSLCLEQVETKELGAIFRHLIKLEKLRLIFTECSRINSKYIESDPEWNVSKLVELRYLYVNTFAPGISPDLIAKLRRLRTSYHLDTYDLEPKEHQIEQNENNEENEVDSDSEYLIGNEEEWEEREWGDDSEGEEENRNYDIMEFEVYARWFCDA